MGTASTVAKGSAVCGAISMVAFLVAFSLSSGDAPDSGSTGVQVADFASDHRGQLLAAYLLLAAALPALMVFAAGVYGFIAPGEGEGEDEREWLAMASLVSAVAAAGFFGAGIALFMAVAYRPDTDPAVVRALWDAAWLAINAAGFGFSAWIAIVAVATFRHGVLPVWTAWIGVPVALIGFIGPLAVKAGTGPFSPQGWFAVVVALTFAVWVLGVSLAAWRSARAPVRGV